MIRNYLKIAWRNMMKYKIFSFINILGLSAGLACCMLITLYILNETSYDRYQEKGDQIYQLGTEFIGLGNFKKLPNTPAAMGEMMKQVYPEIKQSTRMIRLFNEDKTLLQYQPSSEAARSFYETHGYLADSTFFRMFTYHFIEGNPSTALTQPNAVVLSEEIATKIFGNTQALNKVIHISSSTNGDHDFLITGVFRPINKPSHIDGRFFMSMQGGYVGDMIKNSGVNLANNNMYYTYFLLAPGADPKKLQAQFPAFMDKYAGKDLKAVGFSKWQYLVALKDIHLHSGSDNDVTPSGSTTYLYILASIALFTLLIACINFMNLATARSSRRSSEVGIRKVLGAERKYLIAQFLGESVLMSLIAFIIALMLTKLLIPAFNSVSGKNLSLSFSDGLTVLVFLLVAVATGLFAGSYPAFYLSSFNPAKVLKGKFSNSLAAVSLRKGLVVFQFVISVALIVASVVIGQQMNYLRSADLGFDKERQIVIPLRSANAKKIYAPYKDELLKLSAVANVGASSYYPGITNYSDNVLYKQGESMKQGKDIRMNYVDTRFLQTLNIQLLAGRLFSDDFRNDTAQAIILNNKAIEALGYSSPEEAVGKNIFSDFGDSTYRKHIVGVVKDFHYEDLHLPVTPYGFQLNLDPSYNYMIVHAKAGNINNILQSMKNTWSKLNPLEPFEYSFLDSNFQKNYDAETRLSAIVGYFTAIAILISCLGLFGLATFSAEQRIKEIGVRKALGASVSSIVGLLSKDFLKLVALAIIIASPLAWLAMNKWLDNFAYRIRIAWTVFAITAIIALLIALFTISFQAVKAAVANPVKSLRSE
jgi:putative ABC transport system permease protein